MKKMLAMVLVLGLAAYANAGISLVDNYAADGTVSINLSGGQLQGYTMFLDVSGGSAGAPGTLEQFKFMGTTVLNLVAPSAAAGQGGHDWKFTGAGITGTSFITGPIDFIASIPVTVESFPATVTLTIPSGGTYVDGVMTSGEVSISIVPEPITMSLLGVGGLLLRRRFA